MRQAPPVGVTCTGGGLWRASGAALAALAAGAVLAWGLLHLELAPSIAMGSAGLSSLAVGFATWRATVPTPVEVRWDGRCWRADGAEGEVDVMLDLGAWMLLRWRGEATGARWLPLPQSDAAGAWPALRRALYAAPHPRAAGEEA